MADVEKLIHVLHSVVVIERGLDVIAAAMSGEVVKLNTHTSVALRAVLARSGSRLK